MLHVERFETIEELVPLRARWDQLAAHRPFGGWTWLTNWWRHYGGSGMRSRRLCTLGAFDCQHRLIAIAPLYVERSAARGTVLRLLGDGEACSDYLTFLCEPAIAPEAAAALAGYIAEELPRHHPWDLIDLVGPAADDPMIALLAEELADRRCSVHRRDGPNCWAIPLPPKMDDYRERLPKKRRKRLDRLADEYLSSGRAILRFCERFDQMEHALELLIAMHQRRRRSLGDPGCYSSPTFEAFVRAAVPAMFAEGKMQLACLEIDGRPAAVDLLLLTPNAACAYQGAVEPDMLEYEPGKLLHWTLARWSIRQGYRYYDFLRGDEPYKAQLGAEPRPMTLWRIAAPHLTAQLRQRLWLAARNVKHLLAGLKPAPVG